MAHRKSSFRGRGISDSQRRKKSWIQVTGPAVNTGGGFTGQNQTPNINLFIAANSGGAQTEGNSIGLFSDPILDRVPAESTILRLRGSVNVPKNEVGAIEVDNFAVGIGVMEAGAAALGAFPNPATPEGGAWDGWMFYRSAQAGSLDANATIFDVKAMRKVQSGSAIIIVVGRFSATADGSLLSAGTSDAVQINLRGLILLP